MFKKNKNEMAIQEDRINKKVLDEHERILSKLKDADPNSDEYDAYMKQLKDLESIQREKEKNRNCNKDSKRAHIGANLIKTGGGIVTAVGLMALEKSVPISGQTEKSFINSLFKKL